MAVITKDAYRSVVEAIGPQKMKIQAQPNQNTTKDEETEISETDLVSNEKKNLVANEDSASTCSQPEATSIQSTFQARLMKYKKTLMPSMCLKDQNRYSDPQNLSEFSQTIFENMKAEELERMVPVDYLSKMQTEIKDTSRAFLIEWIIDVHRKFRLTPEALYVAVYVIDQFLSKQHLQKS